MIMYVGYALFQVANNLKIVVQGSLACLVPPSVFIHVHVYTCSFVLVMVMYSRYIYLC